MSKFGGSQSQVQKIQQKLSPKQLLLLGLIEKSVTELEEVVKAEVEKNPMLDLSSEMEAESLDSMRDRMRQDEDQEESKYEDDYRERLEPSYDQEYRRMDQVSVDSLADNLREQLGLRTLTERQLLIAEEIIGSLDDAGYLSRSVELLANDMAAHHGLEVEPAEVLQVLGEVQQLEPAGIAARSLQECFSLQLHRVAHPDIATRCAIEVVDCCFELLGKRSYDNIIANLGITREQLQTAESVIRLLDPKPGSGQAEPYGGQYVIPDFVVRQDARGRLRIFPNSRMKLRLSSDYMEMMNDYEQKSGLNEEQGSALEFFRTNKGAAEEFIELLSQRDSTLSIIVEAIVKAQSRFFVTGDQADLRPLLQKDIAERTGFDIGTISRAVNSKYVQADFGVILLKDCFSHSRVTAQGEQVATKAMLQKLQQIIAEEDRSNPLSDDELALKLAEQGVHTARRTVAKYRQVLGIPEARLRRAMKLVVLLVVSLLWLGQYASAQQPMSYFDSIIYARTRQAAASDNKAKKATSQSNPKQAKARPGERIVEVQPVDADLARGDELIDSIYNGATAPSSLWYGSNISGRLVRLRNLSMDSLPDEVSLRLVKPGEEFCFPVKNIITSPYGWRWNRPHRGVDIRLATGDPVHCAFNGVVRIARPMGAYGNLVVVRHYNGLETVYGHLSKINVKPLQAVKAGAVLGLGGSTGRSTGPHLHFEVRFQYEPFDPEWVLDFKNYTLRTRKLFLDKSYFGIRKPRAGEALVYKADKSIVPESPQKEKKPPRQIYYTLQAGDRLDLVAARYHTTEEKIKALNPSVKKFKPGVEVRVK